VLIDNFKLALKNISERKARSFLTLLGICIGIMAIISLMGIGEGMQSAITGELSSLSDTIVLSTGEISASAFGGGGGFEHGDDGEYLTDRDISDIERINGIRDVSTILFTAGMITYNSESKGVSLVGIDAENMENIFGIGVLGLESGEFITEGKQNTCVIGYNVAYEYFDADIKLGNRIDINGKNFAVVGIYNRQGSGMSTETDDNIHITPRDFEKITGMSDSSSAIIRIYDVTKADAIAEEIEQTINENHGNDEFANAITMTSIIESVQEIIAIAQVVLLSIASIALVVASIGIMNTMLTSVMERTREIGIMKAIGATNKDVLFIFIMEGILISIIGGVAGIILGVFGSKALSTILTSSFGGALNPVITTSTVVLAILVAILVGMLSSLYPARKAAKMSPIEAVRYE
jgi:putative ABC transport system permease protein